MVRAVLLAPTPHFRAFREFDLTETTVAYLLRFLRGEDSGMARIRSVFWDDLDKDFQSGEEREAFARESAQIQTVDRIINALNDAIVESGLSKAELARRLHTDPASLRRLLTSSQNPTIRTLVPVAAELGLEITVVPTKKRAAGAGARRLK